MARLVLFIFCCIAYNSFAQNATDTITLKNGEIYSGKFIMEDVKNYQFLSTGANQITDYPKEAVFKIVKNGSVYFTLEQPNKLASLESSKEAAANKSILISTNEVDITNENLLAEFRLQRTKTKLAGRYFKSAGGWGISAGAFIIAGSALALTAVLVKKPAVSIVGAGIAGLGIAFMIPAFERIHKAGKAIQ